jgi:two-component system sensor histidine kinase VicK
VAIDSLELQLASALQRFSTLQRRAEGEAQVPKLLARALQDLERALEEVKVAQEQIIENRHRMEQLQADLARQYQKYWQLFDDMPQAYVVTRPDSAILEVNKAASDLFNVSQRFLVGKTLSVFVCEERGRFLTETARAAATDATAEMTLRIRPRERAPLEVKARLTGSDGSLRWILQPVVSVAAVASSSTV